MIYYSGGEESFGIDIASYARFLKLGTNSAGNSLKRTIIDWANSTLLPLVRSKTPVGKGPEHAKDKWRIVVASEGVAGGGGEIVRLVNTARGASSEYAYADFLEYGSERGDSPWPKGTADPNYFYYDAKGRRRRSPSRVTGKTKSARDPNLLGLHNTREGRVWAGGLNPGFDTSIGGPVAGALEELGRITPDATSGFETSVTPRGRVLYRSFSDIIAAMIEDVFSRVVIAPGRRGVKVPGGFVAPVRGGNAPSIHIGQY